MRHFLLRTRPAVGSCLPRGAGPMLCALAIIAGEALLPAMPARAGGVPQAAPEIVALQPNQPVKRQMAGGESHAYRLPLETRQYVRVLVNQLGVDVVVSLSGPEGAKIVESNSDNGNFGLEPISIVAQVTGTYMLGVRALDDKAPAGQYEARIDQLRPATPEDKNRLAAERVFLEGDSLRSTGKLEGIRQAVPKYEEALALLERASDPFIEGQALHGLGRLQAVLGNRSQALGFYLKALPARRVAGDRRGEATTLNSIGATYISTDEPQKALAAFKQALPIRREVGDIRGEAITLNNIGVIYRDLGEFTKAADYFSQSLPVRRVAGDREGEASVLNNLGSLSQALGNQAAAIDYMKQSIGILQSMDHTRDGAAVIDRMARVYDMQGDHPKALEYFGRMLALERASNDIFGESAALKAMAKHYTLIGEFDKAMDCYRQAIVLYRTFESTTGEFNSLYGMARIERARGNLKEAIDHVAAAIEGVEIVRSKIEMNDLRASYFGTAKALYDFNVSLLMEAHRKDPAKGYDAAALHASERARARTLLELLNEANADIRHDVEPGLLERERAAQHALNVKAEELRRLLSAKAPDAQRTAARTEVEALRTAYQEIQSQVVKSSPRYADLVRPAPLTVPDIQQKVLDPDTLLLEYALGEERSYVWAVASDRLTSYELPKRSVIEAKARDVYDLLTARNQRPKFETPQERQARVAKADAQFPAAAAVLSQMILGPVAAQLPRKRLLVVADGALQFVPFAALPAPQGGPPRATQASYLPLVADHEVVNLPSASSLAVLRQELHGRPAAPKAVAVLADPVFERDDPRLTPVRRTSEPSGMVVEPGDTDVVRAAGDASTDGEAPDRIPRLPFTRQEAEAITALVPAAGSRRLLDFTASRAAASSPELRQYRYVHFATHAFINTKHPELSGVVLSMFDEQGREQDGFLRAHEIYNLKLPVEMVVLSGCRTGLGKEIRGEGLLGLTRGFMYAGAARVLVSLWDVHDEATAALMSRLYKDLLAQKAQRPAAALRAAQVAMWKEKRWQAPYYWAAFVMQGEPR